MQDQRFGMNESWVHRDDVNAALAIEDCIDQNRPSTCQGESDADFALLLLDIVKDVIRENADKFLVRPPLFPPLVPAPPQESDDFMAEELDDLCARAAQPIHNQPRAISNEVPAQEIDWKPEYGNRDAYYSTRQLAKLTGRSISRVRRWVQENKIAAVRFGGEAPKSQMFIPKDQIERLKALGIGEIL